MLYLQSVTIIVLLLNFKQVQLKIISSPSGKVKGFESQTQNNNTFYAFLGIKYAKPPIGNLRFRAPVPIMKWLGVYNATQEGNVCVQHKSIEQNIIIGDEDCLFLNVYTTNLPSNKSTSLLPVLVWIHGGAFIFGSGNLEPHGSDRFLDRNVLVVSFNYRLSIFGFLSTEDTAVPGNYGLKDQVLALQWVQRNVAAFGGDNQQVTIFGESAGAASVHYLRQIKKARNLFQRTIADSGNTLNPWSVAYNPRTMAFRVGLLNGIITSSSKDLIEGLRKINAYQLIGSTILPGVLEICDLLNGLPFAPYLEQPSYEAVYTDFSYEAQEQGNFNTGPLLHGFNSQEGLSFLNAIPWYGQLFLDLYNLFPSGLTPDDMHASSSGAESVGNNIKSYYFHNGSVTDIPRLTNFFSDTEFVRGIVKSTVLESAYSTIYLFRFSYTDSDMNPHKGVGHADELQYLWWTPQFNQSSPEVRLTVDRVLQMWTNFIKTGNPTSVLSPEVNVTWPVVNATGGKTIHYLDIGKTLRTNVNPEKEKIKFWERQYHQYGFPPYNTY